MLGFGAKRIRDGDFLSCQQGRALRAHCLSQAVEYRMPVRRHENPRAEPPGHAPGQSSEAFAAASHRRHCRRLEFEDRHRHRRHWLRVKATKGPWLPGKIMFPNRLRYAEKSTAIRHQPRNPAMDRNAQIKPENRRVVLYDE